MAGQPDLTTIPGSFAALDAAFQPARAGNISRTIQFNFTGAEPGTWTLSVRRGAFGAREGAAEAPNAEVTVDSEEWLHILRGESNAITLFMSGKIRVAPPSAAMDLMQFQNWFQW